LKSGYSWTELVEIAIEVERAGEEFYRGASRSRDGPERESLLALADAERRHAEVFHSLLPKGVGEGTKGISARESRPYIEAIVGETLLGYLKECREPGTCLGSLSEILEFALGFEEESVTFYKSMLGHVTSAAGPTVGKVIEEEKRHIETIRSMMASHASESC
jgi:rubrerythrin